MGVDYDYESLCRRIQDMPHWKLCTLAAACAEKVAPIVQLVGLKHTWLLVDRCLTFVWSAPSSDLNLEEANRLIQAIESTPEWNSDGDNDYLPFEVARALDRLHLALSAIAVFESTEDVEALISLMRDLADSWDATLYGVGNFAELLALPGLEEIEVASQERLVAMLEQATTPSSSFLAKARNEAQFVGTQFRTATPFYCYAFLSN